MAIGTVEFDLSMVSPESGEFLTARAYTVEGVKNADGSLRQLSIGQLVMAICLNRASELEADIIALMEEMSTTSAQLADMTKIEQAVIDDFAANQNGHAYNLNNVTVTSSTSAVQLLRDLEVINSSQTYVRNDSILSNADIMYDDFITQIESKMDEKNSFSQQKMIELQSLTNKRDQSYDMISNILKSLNTTMTGIVNNT
ncbi:MAG: hypothetical protein IJG18_12625 [Kiritimatiellae bacterium]|nr:hypothetical protein [Kiritimatiellia bacterium]